MGTPRPAGWTDGARVTAGALITGVLLGGCSGSPAPSDRASTASSPDEQASRPATPPGSAPTLTDRSSGSPSGDPLPAARRIDPAHAREAVLHLAGTIGPRPATSPAYRRAAGWVERRLRSHGYDVQRQTVTVPAGVSWGVPVAAGSADNLIATLPGTRLRDDHLVVGAHLDTVPQAPGAEDNASGVAAMLATAAAVADRPTRLPVVFVAFAAEEPRGPTDDDHHYGSRHYVASLRPAERTAVRRMVSLDRVGVGSEVPVCSATGDPDPLQQELLATARRVGVPTTPCANRSSDHWSFVRGGLGGVRLGGTSYPAYHSSADVPSVVDVRQIQRVGRLLLAWLAPRP